MATRRELEDAIRECNQAARAHERRQILSESVRVTGIIANIAARIESFADTTKAAPTGASFDEAVHQALTVLWEAADRICGKRRGLSSRC